MIWFLLAIADPSVASEIVACQEPDQTAQFTLCLAERSFERSDRRLNDQWAITYPHVKVTEGRRAARKLREVQRVWIKKTERECDSVAAPTPVTQQNRNFLGCMSSATDKRTAELHAMTGKK
jgi:uncharacterized protein YecT (DUF1311 family)